MDICRQRGLDEPLILTGTSRISGSWRYFLEDGRAFSLVPEDFARKEVGEGVAAYQLEPPAFLPLEVAWNKNASSDVMRVLEIIVDLTHDRRGTARRHLIDNSSPNAYCRLIAPRPAWWEGRSCALSGSSHRQWPPRP